MGFCSAGCLLCKAFALQFFAVPGSSLPGFCLAVFCRAGCFVLQGVPDFLCLNFCSDGFLLCRVLGILRRFLIGGKEKRGQIFNDLKFVVFCFGFASFFLRVFCLGYFA